MDNQKARAARDDVGDWAEPRLINIPSCDTRPYLAQRGR
jgi:hypothetical protein